MRLIRIIKPALQLLLLLSSASCREEQEQAAPASALVAMLPDSVELFRTLDRAAIIDSARSLMRADSNVALVSIDTSGQPRVRTVKAFVDPPDPADPAGSLTVWIMTRRTTRKVAQLRENPRVTLYFNDDARVTYATVMGIATIHTDPEHPGAKRHYESGYAPFFWPDFPDDFVMIEVRARWLEFMGPGVSNDSDRWRPQAVTFEP
jgi:general stress protein 26